MEKDSRRRRRTERDGKKKKARWLNKDGETGWAQTEGEKLKVKWAAKGMRLSGWRSERGKRGEYKMRRGFLFSFLAPFIFLHIFPSLYQVCTLDLVKHRSHTHPHPHTNTHTDVEVGQGHPDTVMKGLSGNSFSTQDWKRRITAISQHNIT